MDSKLQELTEKIYREGVEKGEQQAREIIEAAQKESAALIRNAQGEADAIIAMARKKAEDLRQSLESDMRLAASQSMSALKQQIMDAISARVIDRPIAEALSNPATMAEFLREIIGRWSSPSGDIPGLEVLLPQAQQERLSAVLESALCRELASGLSLRFTKALRAGFQVQPCGLSYKISLTDEDFREYFKEYLRPRMRAFLFGE